MTDAHKTSCWMSPLIKGTDAERAELKRTITVAVRSACGNLEGAAVLLGVSSATLRRYLTRLGLDALVDRVRPDGGAARKLGSVAGRRGGRPRLS